METETKKTIEQEAQEYFELSYESIEEMVNALNTKNEEEREGAIQTIQEDALEIATGKNFDGTRTYMILLGTGGPAARIIGELDENDDPETATFQYQNWFTPWTDARATKEQEDKMITYAQQFYFGE